MELQNREGIYSIDIKVGCSKLVKYCEIITLFKNEWGNYGLDGLNSFHSILVIESSIYKCLNTLDAIKKFSHVVSIENYLIVEYSVIDDLCLKKAYNGGTAKTIEVFLQLNLNFIPDSKWMIFLIIVLHLIRKGI